MESKSSGTQARERGPQVEAKPDPEDGQPKPILSPIVDNHPLVMINTLKLTDAEAYEYCRDIFPGRFGGFA